MKVKIFIIFLSLLILLSLNFNEEITVENNTLIENEHKLKADDCVNTSGNFVNASLRLDYGKNSYAFDDVIIWKNKNNLTQSKILVSDKALKGGIHVFNLKGEKQEHISGERINSLDIRYNITYKNNSIDLLMATNREKYTIDLFSINSSNGKIEELIGRINTGTGSLSIGQIYGGSFYQNKTSKEVYAFVSSRINTVIKQFKIVENNTGFNGVLVREWEVQKGSSGEGRQIEGIEADDEQGILYLGQEDVAVYGYNANPNTSTQNRFILAKSGVDFTPDVEGLTIFKQNSTHGYIIISSQGDNSFVVFDRWSKDKLKKFKVSFENNFVTGTDGITSIRGDFGKSFSEGIFSVHDDRDRGSKDGVKVVNWACVQKIINN